MDDGRGALTPAGLLCRSCGTQLGATAKFCSECSAAVTSAPKPAEYKQVTVLFADVVHSMDIAEAVGAERLREIMTELVTDAARVVQRYGGTVDKFTGDGVMAVFGAPAALEDHALRACLAALCIQEAVTRLAAEVERRDGVDLHLRVGLNSGQVIAGEIGSGALGYTALGAQVGLAQRMESVAPPGGVMVSASTARLVEGAAALGAAELVHIKGTDRAIHAQRLLSMSEERPPVGRAEPKLVGRQWEMSAIESLLDRAVDGHGAVVGVVGLPGIGKSRLVREVSAMAAARSVDVFTAFCESHTNQVPFHAVARLLRAITGIKGLDPDAARARIRAQFRDAEPEDLLLFDDLLGTADPDADLPKIDPDARRRRLTALVNAASLARRTSAVYVVEDLHWIDEVSEAMIAEFLTVIPQTPSLVLITYRPEYQGILSPVHGAQTIALAPLSDSETTALVSELLGPDPSVGALGQTIAERAAGNPFFAEEIVRELAERVVLHGKSGAYISTAQGADVSMPATVQATIAARIDRLNPGAKRTLSAAAIIGSRFSRGLLETLGIDPVLESLVGGELIDQVSFTRQPEYVFHHPLIRTVAYESQLKSDRAGLHRRIAATIEARDPAAADENAALIAEHLEAAGDLHAAYGWHMRAAAWSASRDIRAAQMSWHRARALAYRLPEEDSDRISMRFAPWALVCANAWRTRTTMTAHGFKEFRELCITANDQVSLAIGMSGVLTAVLFQNRFREAAAMASELTALVDLIDDPVLTVGLTVAACNAKFQAGEVTEALQVAQRIIDLADNDPIKGNLVIGSPLAFALAVRGCTLGFLGRAGWKDDLEQANAMARDVGDTTSRVGVILYKSIAAVNGVLGFGPLAIDETAEVLQIAEQSGDDFALLVARLARAVALVNRDAPQEELSIDPFTSLRDAMLAQHYAESIVARVEFLTAKVQDQLGDIDRAIQIARANVELLFEAGEMVYPAPATAVLVEVLLRYGTDAGLREAEAAIERLSGAPADGGLVIRDIWLLRLRALLARARGDDVSYREYRDRYRDMAKTLGFEGHIKWAEAMP